jgi:hypothetical protein
VPSQIYTSRLAELVNVTGAHPISVPAGRRWVVTYVLCGYGGTATPTSFALYRVGGAEFWVGTIPGDGVLHSIEQEMRAVFYGGEQLGCQISGNPGHMVVTGFDFAD